MWPCVRAYVLVQGSVGVWVCGCVGVWVETIVFTVPPDGTARQVASHSYKPPPPLPADAASSLHMTTVDRALTLRTVAAVVEAVA